MNNQFTSDTQALPIIQSNGGLNTTASLLSVADNESTSLLNIDIDQWGSIIKRNGYLNLNASNVNSSAASNGMTYYQQQSGTDYLVAVFGNKLYKMDSLDGTFDDITNGLTFTAGQNNQCQFAVYTDILFGTNNVNVPFKVTDTTAATMGVPTGLTKALCVETFSDFMFLGNVTVSGTAYKSRVYFSSPGAPETYDSADWVNVSASDGQDVTCLKTLGDKLVIFKDRSIHVAIFTGDSDIPFVFVKTPSHVGCVARDSVQEVNNGLVFLSHDGFYYFDGSNSIKISDKINKTMKNDIAVSRNANAQSCVYRAKNQYICFLTASGGTKNTFGLIWDYYSKAWLKYTGYIDATTNQNVNSITSFVISGEERVYFADSAGFAYRMDTGTNDYPLGVVTKIKAHYKTKWFYFGDIMNQKAVPHVVLYLDYNQAVLTMGYSYDFEDTNQYILTIDTSNAVAVYGTAVYGVDVYAGSGGFSVRKDLQGRGRVFRISFENEALSETFKINGFGISVYQETAA